MNTGELTNHISAEEILYLIMKFSPAEGPGRSPRLRHLILPPSRKDTVGCLVKTPWLIHLRRDTQPDAELVIELRGDVVLGARLNPGDDADVDLSDWQGYHLGVSRRHLMLRPTNRNLYAIDLDSTNGSLFNGLPMTPSRAYPLSAGDLLTLARLHVRVVRVSRADSRTPARPPETHQLGEGKRLSPVLSGI